MNFDRLEEDFALATSEIFGAPAPLMLVNPGGKRTSAEAYKAFKAAFLADPECQRLVQAALKDT